MTKTKDNFTMMNKFFLGTLFLLIGSFLEISAFEVNPHKMHGDIKCFTEGKTFYISGNDGSILDYEDFNLDESESLVIKLVNSTDIITLQVERNIFINGTIECTGSLEIIGNGKIYLGEKGIIEASQLVLKSTLIDETNLNAWSNKEKSYDLIVKGKIVIHSKTVNVSELILIAPRIKLTKDSFLENSSQYGGGRILIGGGWQGKDETIQNALVTKVEKGATIKAEGNGNSEGGIVVIWSDNKTTFLGIISASGTKKGGTVEISSSGNLMLDEANIEVDVSSLNGAEGLLLLDPLNITIQNSLPDIQGDSTNLDFTANEQLNDPINTPSTNGNANSVITAQALNSFLVGSTAIQLAAQNSITVSAPIIAPQDFTGSLTLSAPTVNLYASITNSDEITPLTSLNGIGVTTVNVGPNSDGSNNQGKIQNGVQLVNFNGVVNVAIGNYSEEIKIDGKDLTLRGADSVNCVINTPQLITNAYTYGLNTYNSIILVTNASNTIIENLTIDANYFQDTDNKITNFYSLSYFDAGGTISNVLVKKTKDMNPLSNMKGGSGICGAVTKGNYTLSVDNCIVDEYKRLGIAMKGANLVANVTNNTILTGFPFPISLVIEGGIRFVDKAQGSISNNTITYISSSETPYKQCPAIYAKSGDNLIISGNTITNNDIGISCEYCGTGLIIENNTCSNNFIGIQCRFVNDNLLIQNNVCTQNEGGIYLYMNSGRTQIISNQFNQNSINGIRIYNDSKKNSFIIIGNIFLNSGLFPIKMDGGALDSNIPFIAGWEKNQFSNI